MATVPLIRTALRLMPAPLRERTAARLFMTVRDHGEPAREHAWRERGEETTVGGCSAVAFGEGPVVLLMHGWEGRGLQLSAFVEPLVEAGRRVIAIDGPGHGRTPGIGAMPTFAAALEQAIHEVEPVAIVAHSLGAAASIVAASRVGFAGRVLCLGGPAETQHVFTRARNFMRLPESGRAMFLEHIRKPLQEFRLDDVLDIQGCARAWGGDIHAVLVVDDEEIPEAEARGIVEAAGGSVTVLDGPTHRSVMWHPDAVAAGWAFLAAK